MTYREYLDYILDTGQEVGPPLWIVSGMFKKTIRPADGTLNDPIRGLSFRDAAGYAGWRRARLPRTVELLRAWRGPSPDGWAGGDAEDISSYLAEYLSTATKIRRDSLPIHTLRNTFETHASRFDPGEHMNPSINTISAEWAIEPLGQVASEYDRLRRRIEARSEVASVGRHRPDDLPAAERWSESKLAMADALDEKLNGFDDYQIVLFQTSSHLDLDLQFDAFGKDYYLPGFRCVTSADATSITQRVSKRYVGNREKGEPPEVFVLEGSDRRRLTGYTEWASGATSAQLARTMIADAMGVDQDTLDPASEGWFASKVLSALPADWAGRKGGAQSWLIMQSDILRFCEAMAALNGAKAQLRNDWLKWDQFEQDPKIRQIKSSIESIAEEIRQRVIEQRPCHACGGSRRLDHCPKCGGRGSVYGLGATCADCNGTGKNLRRDQECPNCDAKGYE